MPPASAATYQALVHAAQTIYNHSLSKTTPDSSLIMQALKDVLQLFQQDDSLLTESVRRRNLQISLAGRAANTALLSMRLGLEIGYNERRCTAVGLCALMHDLGGCRPYLKKY